MEITVIAVTTRCVAYEYHIDVGYGTNTREEGALLHTAHSAVLIWEVQVNSGGVRVSIDEVDLIVALFL